MASCPLASRRFAFGLLATFVNSLLTSSRPPSSEERRSCALYVPFITSPALFMAVPLFNLRKNQGEEPRFARMRSPLLRPLRREESPAPPQPESSLHAHLETTHPARSPPRRASFAGDLSQRAEKGERGDCRVLSFPTPVVCGWVFRPSHLGAFVALVLGYHPQDMRAERVDGQPLSPRARGSSYLRHAPTRWVPTRMHPSSARNHPRTPIALPWLECRVDRESPAGNQTEAARVPAKGPSLHDTSVCRLSPFEHRS